MKLLLASNNQHKMEELQAILGSALSDCEILRLSDLGDLQLEVEESGLTLEENAYLKARAFHELSGLPCIADDTGLEVDALNGAPGVHTARFAGENASYADNVALLLERLQGVDEKQRTACFRTVICYVDDMRTLFSEGACPGRIATAAQGSAGFGYDPVFIPENESRSFAELSSEHKNSISHRGRALQAFARQMVSLQADGDSTAHDSQNPTSSAPIAAPSLHPVRQQLCRAAVHAIMNNQAALREEIENYCTHEHDLQLLYEALLQIYLFAGFPAALEALTTMRGVLEQRDISWYADDSEVYDVQLFNKRGTATCRRIYTGVYAQMRERVAQLSAHLDQWMVVEGYGKVLARPQLDLCSRELVNVAVLAASGWDRQLYSHLRGALNAGATSDECEMALQAAAPLSSTELAERAQSIWTKVLSSNKKTMPAS